MYEYMAMGKPVITTRRPGILKEFGNDNGVIYVDTPEEILKKAIELSRTESAKEEGIKARRFVERYSGDSITDEFERVLDEVSRRG